MSNDTTTDIPGSLDDTQPSSDLTRRKRCMVWVRTGPAETDQRMISAEIDPLSQVIYFEGNSQMSLGDAQIERIAVESAQGGMATLDVDLENLRIEATGADGQATLRLPQGDQALEEAEEARRLDRERQAARRHPGFLDDGMRHRNHP